VRAATADILARAKALRPEARISGVVVQAMVVRPKARELQRSVTEGDVRVRLAPGCGGATRLSAKGWWVTKNEHTRVK
jgi:acyl-CoA synthetase (NDP forming)